MLRRRWLTFCTCSLGRGVSPHAQTPESAGPASSFEFVKPGRFALKVEAALPCLVPPSITEMSQLKFEPVALDDFAKVLGTTSTEVSSVALGGKILSCSDEWFAPASDLLKVSNVQETGADRDLTCSFELAGRSGTQHEGPVWSKWCPL